MGKVYTFLMKKLFHLKIWKYTIEDNILFRELRKLFLEICLYLRKQN